MKYRFATTVAAVLAACSISFSDTLKVTLDNISGIFNFRYENNRLVGNNPVITDYSQVEELAKSLYQQLTGKSQICGVEILDSAKFMEKMESIASNVNYNQNYSEFYSISRDSVFVKQTDLERTMINLSHGLGHSTTEDKSEGTGLEGKIVEEAKAISFSRAWAEKLKDHVYFENDSTKGNVRIGKMKFDKEKSSIHYLADQMVEKMKKDKPTFLEVYQTIVKEGFDQFLKYMKDDETYIGLKEGKIKQKVYTDL